MFSSVGVALMLASLGAAIRPEGEAAALVLRGAVFAAGWALILAGPRRFVSVGYLSVGLGVVASIIALWWPMEYAHQEVVSLSLVYLGAVLATWVRWSRWSPRGTLALEDGEPLHELLAVEMGGTLAPIGYVEVSSAGLRLRGVYAASLPAGARLIVNKMLILG